MLSIQPKFTTMGRSQNIVQNQQTNPIPKPNLTQKADTVSFGSRSQISIIPDGKIPRLDFIKSLRNGFQHIEVNNFMKKIAEKTGLESTIPDILEVRASLDKRGVFISKNNFYKYQIELINEVAEKELKNILLQDVDSSNLGENIEQVYKKTLLAEPIKYALEGNSYPQKFIGYGVLGESEGSSRIDKAAQIRIRDNISPFYFDARVNGYTWGNPENPYINLLPVGYSRNVRSAIDDLMKNKPKDTLFLIKNDDKEFYVKRFVPPVRCDGQLGYEVHRAK